MATHFEKVLIVDDNKIDRWLLRKNIERADLADEIIEAETGVEALDLLTTSAQAHHHLPELIFMDVNMPMLSGLEFLDVFEQVRSQNKIHCRIVMLCSVNDPEERKKAFSYNNVVGYYMKPLTLDALLELKEQIKHTNAS